MYFGGEGVPKDYTEAVKWFRKAAEQGNAEAQNLLGSMYLIGMGVIQDFVYAHMWFNIAASNGIDSAKAHKKRVEGIMNSSDISEAQRLATECVKKNYKGC